METRIPFAELERTLVRAMEKLGLEGERAARCGRLFAETTRDGVYSHGVNRFPRFVGTVESGLVDVKARAERVGGKGALERWTGHRAPGNLSAQECMGRAIELAREHGLGCVALNDTNHWMRAGSYGWQAAEAGFIGMCWTNTMPNMVPWGARTRGIGNNPLVMAVPRANGAHVVLDMAMSQYSFGVLAGFAARGEQTPIDGGYDTAGKISRDPKAIDEAQGGLPIGYWKGTGLSVLLDLTAAMLSVGRATHELPLDFTNESGQSQVFMAFDVAALGGETERIADDVVAALKAIPASEGGGVRYPGEKVLRVREENLRLGVPVVEERWRELRDLAG
jgi:3-dehydro-L-gulonate 2-dehydrogenase